MCRLFGFRSVIKSQVHTSLVSADNALSIQSNVHKDGWGVAYYIHGVPHIIKAALPAYTDSIFKKVSGVVSSETVVAHIRRATAGNNTLLNTHPFQHGKWVFAHNGKIKNFGEQRLKLLAMVSPELRRFILGETDSEIIFYFLLSHLTAQISLEADNPPMKDVAATVRQAVEKLIEIVGPFDLEDVEQEEHHNYFTFILTNGSTMVAHHGGKELFYSTYKNRCIDRDVCPCFSPECENPSESGYINHLIFSSEKLAGDNIWLPMEMGQILCVDHSMKLTIV